MGGWLSASLLADLYALILSSKLEYAKRFKHWVTSEILLTIYKRETCILKYSEKTKGYGETQYPTVYYNSLVALGDLADYNQTYRLKYFATIAFR